MHILTINWLNWQYDILSFDSFSFVMLGITFFLNLIHFLLKNTYFYLEI